jgi:hypothetical protein
MRIMLLLAFLVALPAGATDVYRWVDANGQAHYSDQWQPGAEKIRLEEAPGYSSPKAGADATAGGAGSATAQPATKAARFRYSALEIASPSQQEVLWNIAGQVRVSLRVTPELQPGHSLRLLLDGTAQDLPAGSTDLQLQEVYRGVHTLTAQAVDQAGKVLIESQPTTFVVRQTSSIKP